MDPYRSQPPNTYYPPVGGANPYDPYGQPQGGYGDQQQPHPQYGMTPQQGGWQGQQGGWQGQQGGWQGQQGGVQQGMQQGMPPQGMPQGQGRRKAFICGINYRGTSHELRGCMNDANCIRHLLKTKFGFQDNEILFFNEDQPDPNLRPTRASMLQGFRWLMADARPGDSLFFHYSGHGGQVPDRTGTEADGLCETLCPLDFERAGMLVDKELNQILVLALPQGARLHAVIDACHSGTVLDLPHEAVTSGGVASWQSNVAGNRPTAGFIGGQQAGWTVQFAASKDDQTAADTAALSGTVSTGAATFSFIQAIEDGGPNINYGELLHAMHRALKNVGKPGGASAGGGLQDIGMNLVSGLVGGMMHGQSLTGAVLSTAMGSMSGAGSYHHQTPVLSSNKCFDLNARLQI